MRLLPFPPPVLPAGNPSGPVGGQAVLVAARRCFSRLKDVCVVNMRLCHIPRRSFAIDSGPDPRSWRRYDLDLHDMDLHDLHDAFLRCTALHGIHGL